MKSRIFILFSIIFISELFAVFLSFGWLEYITKPLIMLLLGAHYVISVKGHDSGISKPVLVAIVFSWLGDVALLFQKFEPIFFMMGLGSFLIAHIGYILAYNQHRSAQHGTELLGVQKFRFALPIVLAGTGLITVLYPHLGELRIPVSVYALVLVVMVLKALFRFGFTNAKSFWLVFIGALLFMVSDSLIAINKFLSGFDAAGLAIMSTYMVAQFLLIKGLLLHER